MLSMMGLFGTSEKTKGKPEVRTAAKAEKDLRRLSRMDLLELLTEEVRVNEEQSSSLAELTELTERLKGKLDDKDAQIERLKHRLDDKDAQIAQMKTMLDDIEAQLNRLDGARSTSASAAGIFERTAKKNRYGR